MTIIGTALVVLFFMVLFIWLFICVTIGAARAGREEEERRKDETSTDSDY